MRFIRLTPEEAAAFRYKDRGKSALRPIERADGDFFLGIECINDPMHGAMLAELAETRSYEGPDMAKWRENATGPVAQQARKK